jgi:SHS2 domain-containing protein
LKPYELLEHTADAKFRAYGSTREEAFANAVRAMTAIVVDPATIGTTQEFPISIKASSLQRLLFDLLDQILYLLDTEHFIPASAEGLKITEHEGMFHLTASLQGDDAKKWPGNLKAVTYSEMIVEQQHDGRWLLQAVIDI